MNKNIIKSMVDNYANILGSKDFNANDFLDNLVLDIENVRYNQYGKFVGAGLILNIKNPRIVYYTDKGLLSGYGVNGENRYDIFNTGYYNKINKVLEERIKNEQS